MQALAEKVKSLRGIFTKDGPGPLGYNRRAQRWEAPWEFLNIVQAIHGEELAQDFRARPGAQWAGILPRSFLMSRQFGPFATAFPGVSEIVKHTLYHFRTYAAAGYTERQFFGETFGNATNGYADTNLATANQMSGGEAMLVQTIRVHHIPDPTDYNAAVATAGVAFGEVLEVLQDRCSLEFKIGDKPYFIGAPLLLFPSGMGPGSVVNGSAANGGVRGISYANNGSPDATSLYEMSPPVLILPTQTFAVIIRWVLAQAITTTTTARLGVLLDGLRVRSVQ